MRPRLTFSIALNLAAVAVSPLPQAQGQRPFLIPFNTSFSHSDNHWIAWMPTHPVYEAIEVRSSVDTLSPNGASVQVFLTERAGSKNQVRYYNTEAAAKAFRGPNAHFREMDYKVTGEKGSPQSLALRFNDIENRLVELSMEFAPGQPLTDLHAGLTNQMGHNRDVLFLIFFREKAASAVRNRIVIDGKDFSITAERATSEEQLSRTGYRSSAFVVTFPFGKSQYAWEGGMLTNSWRRTFRAVQGPTGQDTLRSEAPDGTKIEILTTSSGDMREYKHLSRAHTVRIAFQPALPSLDSARGGQRIRYQVSIDDFGVLVHGTATVQKSGNRVVIDWQHASPDWAKSYHFQSIAQPTAKGYDLEVRRTPVGSAR